MTSIMDFTEGSRKNTDNGRKQSLSKRDRYLLLSVFVSCGAFAALYVCLGFQNALRFGIVLLFIPILTALQFREKKMKCTPEVLMNEVPTVIGMMSVTLSENGSFDSAIRYIAENGPKNISKIFKGIISSADCRCTTDIKTSVLQFVSELPTELSSFRRAMHIVVTAFESNDEKERLAMMKDAESIVLEGLRTLGSTYSSKLSTPCMMIFGLGIMVPMILISILPMLSIGGQFSVSGISSELCTFIILIVIPAIVGLVIVSMKGKNPFLEMESKIEDLKYALPLLSALPIYLALNRTGMSTEFAMTVSAVSAGLITLILIFPAIVKEKKRASAESVLKDVLFELGNRLSMRENFDVALEKAFTSRKDCEWLGAAIKRELALSRGDFEGAVRTVISPVSKLMADFYCDVYRASIRDIKDAGKLACSIAHQLQDQNSVRKDIENKLKSMLDMMTGTAAVFAPLILGLSVMMMGPISDMTGQVFFTDITQTLIIYLIELSVLIAFLSSNLMCRERTVDIMYRFCLTMPISLVVFTVCSMITI